MERSDDLDAAIARVKKDGIGGFIAPVGAFTYAHRTQLVQLALKHRLPGIYWVRDFVEAGGLMSYGASFGEVGRRAAYFVDKILKGATPADLPVEQPTRFALVDMQLRSPRRLASIDLGLGSGSPRPRTAAWPELDAADGCSIKVFASGVSMLVIAVEVRAQESSVMCHAIV